MGGSEADWGFPNPATPPGSSAYYSIRLAPAAQRDDLAALHGWRQRVRSVPERIADPRVANAQLQWWREELERIFAGCPTHPLGLRLAAAAERHGLPQAPFAQIVQATQISLAHPLPATVEDLTAAAEADLGALFELLTRAAQTRDPNRIARARRLGAYAGLVYGIRDSGWSIRRGRLGFVCTDLLRKQRLSAGDLTVPHGRERLPGVLAAVAERARAVRTAAGSTADLPLTLRIRVRLLDRLLHELARSAFDVADRRLGLPPTRKLWHAWRESRR